MLERNLARLLVGQETRQTIRGLVTVRDLLGAWRAVMEDRADIAPGTVKSMTAVLKRMVPELGGVHLRGLVSSGALQDYVTRRVRSGAAASSVRLELRHLAMAWRWAESRELVPGRLILPVVKGGPSPDRNRRTPTWADVGALVSYLEREGRPELAAAIHLQAGVGARVSEVAGLTWSGVDLVDGVVHLTGKTGPRAVPLAPELVARLKALPRKTDRVFPPSTYNAIRGDLRRLCELAGVEPFPSHGLRRLAVDTLLRAGVDVGTAASITGHSPQVMLVHYRQVTADDRRTAVAQARLGALPSGAVVQFTKKGRK
jgi:integrase